MKSSIPFLLVLFCTVVVLAAKQSQAKKGCNAYGLACYGGHGKRSLSNAGGTEQDDLRPDTILQMFPNEASALNDAELDAFPRYRLIKIMKSLSSGHQRRSLDHVNDIDYADALSRDSNSSFK